MKAFRHHPLVRMLALGLGLQLAVTGCTSTGVRNLEQAAWYRPVPVDSIVEAGELTRVRVSLTDSAMVSVDDSTQVFRGATILELWDLSASGDTLVGTGGAPGPGLKHSYVIPPDALAALTAAEQEATVSGGKVAAGLVLIFAVAALIGLGVTVSDLGD